MKSCDHHFENPWENPEKRWHHVGFVVVAVSFFAKFSQQCRELVVIENSAYQFAFSRNSRQDLVELWIPPIHHHHKQNLLAGCLRFTYNHNQTTYQWNNRNNTCTENEFFIAIKKQESLKNYLPSNGGHQVSQGQGQQVIMDMVSNKKRQDVPVKHYTPSHH